MILKNGKAKIEFLKGIANGTRSVKELVRPITGMYIIDSKPPADDSTVLYLGLDGNKEMTGAEYKNQLKNNQL